MTALFTFTQRPKLKSTKYLYAKNLDDILGKFLYPEAIPWSDLGHQEDTAILEHPFNVEVVGGPKQHFHVIRVNLSAPCVGIFNDKSHRFGRDVSNEDVRSFVFVEGGCKERPVTHNIMALHQ